MRRDELTDDQAEGPTPPLTRRFLPAPISRRPWKDWLIEIGVARPSEIIGPREPAPIPKTVIKDIIDVEVAAGRMIRDTGRRDSRGRWKKQQHPSELFLPPTPMATSAVRREDYDRLEQRYDRDQAERLRRAAARRQPVAGNDSDERQPIRFDRAIWARLSGIEPPQPTCGNPAGCLAPVKAAERCNSCYKYLHHPKHRGEERPAHLVAVTNQKYVTSEEAA